MEVQKEAQRIMTMSVWKMYHSRMQRGGLRLHRSLQLSLVMRNARDLYLSAKLDEEEEEEEEDGGEGGRGAEHGVGRGGLAGEHDAAAAAAEPEPMETQQQEEEEQPPEEEEEAGGGGGRGEARPPPWIRGPAAKPSRKRRSSSLGKMGASDDADAGLVPSKKAKLAEEEERPQGQEGPFPGLARVLQDRFAGLIPAAAAATTPDPEEGKGGGCCRQGEGVLSILVRAVVAF